MTAGLKLLPDPKNYQDLRRWAEDFSRLMRQQQLPSKDEVALVQDNLDVEVAALEASVVALTTTANGKVAKAGDTMTGLLTLSGDPSTALQAATKQYADAGDRFVEIASVGPTAGVSFLDITWTAGAYRAIKVIVASVQGQGTNSSDFYVQVRRGAAFVVGGTDYHSQRAWWWAATGNIAYLNTNAYYISAGGAAVNVPVASEFTVTDATADGGRINLMGLTSYTLWTPSINYAQCFSTGEVLAGSGQLSGLRLGFNFGSTTFAAVGRVIVLGIKS